MSQQNTGKSLSVEELYIKEKRKSTIFMVSTGVFVLLFMGSVAFGWGGSSNTETSNATTSQLPQGADQRGLGGPGGDITRFLDEDGDIDQAAIAEALDRASQFGDDTSQFTDRFGGQIDTALSNGEITSEQAAALKDVFGI